MRLLFAGTPEAAIPALRALMASRHDVVAALTRPDARVGRRGAPTPSPVAAAAAEAGLPVLRPRSLRTAEFAARLRDLEVSAVAVVAYGAMIPESLLGAVSAGWINLHFSLLPAWRGAAPVQAAIRAGDEMTGATTFLIEKDLDTGPVFGAVTEVIRPSDTAGDLVGRLAVSGAELLVATMDGLETGTLHPRPQPTEGVSHAAKIGTAEAEVDFTAPAFAIDRVIRSVTPAPGAWTRSRWGRLGLGPVTPTTDQVPSLGPGRIDAGKRRVLVGTGTVPVQLITVQPAGKRPMPAADWARGARVARDDRLGVDADAPTTGTSLGPG